MDEKGLSLQLYAIRLKDSDLFLPQPQGRGGRGFTHVNPVRFNGKPQTIPRLFPSQKNAHLALVEWSKGKLFRYSSMDSDEDFERRPVASRNIEDMEIIPVTLSLLALPKEEDDFILD